MATGRLQVYRCAICGSVLEVLTGGSGVLTCCGLPMRRLQARRDEHGRNRHVPAIERTPEGLKVKVGSSAHPMQEAHCLEWIELLAGGQVHRQALRPGEAPEAAFDVEADEVLAREYCNIHGLWEGELR